jgi:methyl-accepting chemotaxis protein
MSRNLGSLTVQRKVVVGFLIVALLVAGVGFVGWRTTHSLAEEFADLNTTEIAGLYELTDVERTMARLRINALYRNMTSDPARRAQLKEGEPPWLKAIDEGMQRFAATVETAEEQATLKDWRAVLPAYMQVRERTLELAAEGKTAEAGALRDKEAGPLGAEVLETLKALIKQREARIKDHQRQADVEAAWSMKLQLALVLVGFAAALGFGTFTARVIVRPLQQAVAMLQDHAIIAQVKENAVHVATAAQALASGSEQLSSGTQEQASSLEETAASLKELSSTALSGQSAELQSLVGKSKVAEQGSPAPATPWVPRKVIPLKAPGRRIGRKAPAPELAVVTSTSNGHGEFTES